MRRRDFQTILRDEPSRYVWVHELQIQFRAVLATEHFKGSVGHGRVYYLELSACDPFRHFGSSDIQELRNSAPGVPFLLFPQVCGNFVLYSRLQCSPVFLTPFRQRDNGYPWVAYFQETIPDQMLKPAIADMQRLLESS